MSPFKPKALSRWFSCWLICAAIVGCQSADSPSGSELESKSFAIDFKYSKKEKLGFDRKQFFDERPHLSPYAEIISHVAGEQQISLRALLALMEHESGAVSNPKFQVTKALGDLAAPGDLLTQLREFTKRLRATAHSSQLLLEVDAPNKAILEVLPNLNIKEFASVYQELFPGVGYEVGVLKANDPWVPLQLPWARGSRWVYGGAHSNNGSGRVLSSLDFTEEWIDWREPINVYVVASAAGEVVDHSSCYIEIMHNDTWSTGYYHLDHTMFRTGQKVQANQPIAKYADNFNQAICGGGDSSGPHVHWTLFKDGNEASLTGVELSGYKIQPGRENYDENCSRMYLSKNGVKVCAGTRFVNDATPGGPGGEPPPPPPPPKDLCPSDPNKTAPGQCGCGRRDPVDTVNFVDAQGFSCSDWVGYPCNQAQEQWGYTARQERTLLANCKKSCNICPTQ